METESKGGTSVWQVLKPCVFLLCAPFHRADKTQGNKCRQAAVCLRRRASAQLVNGCSSAGACTWRALERSIEPAVHLFTCLPPPACHYNSTGLPWPVHTHTRIQSHSDITTAYTHTQTHTGEESNTTLSLTRTWRTIKALPKSTHTDTHTLIHCWSSLSTLCVCVCFSKLVAFHVCAAISVFVIFLQYAVSVQQVWEDELKLLKTVLQAPRVCFCILKRENNKYSPSAQIIKRLTSNQSTNRHPTK